MRARTDISLKSRYTATISDLKGVDLNTSPLRVAQNRASRMKNFICDNGVTHKRPGWESLLTITDETGDHCAVNGIFPFNEGGTEVLLIHAGEGIYRATTADGKWSHRRLDDGALGITATPSQCFYQGGKAFIAGCGNYLVYGEFEGVYALKQVAEIAYVPTTSIGCGKFLSEVSTSTVLDAVNLLTRKRKNTGRLAYTNSGAPSIQLDGTPVADSYVTVEGTLLYGKNAADGGTMTDYRYLASISASFKVGTASKNPTATLTVIDPMNSDESVGDTTEIKLQWFHDKNSLIFFSYADSPDQKDHITVTYEAQADAGYDTRRVQDCRFGATFGVDGANDRLFLAGNSRYPNMDIWSEHNDFTYFPDGNTMEVGGSHAAITAYARLSDTTLAVLKEERAGEPTAFYRTGRERTEADGVTLTQWFPVSAGIVGDGTVNPRAVATLSGDVLTLTKEGVHALVLSSNVASGERYARERSRPIHRELVSAALDRAAAISYRGRYYLAMPDTGKCFVADAHYKASFEGSTDYNYEWWVWENVHATCFAEHNDTLLFGTPKGMVCSFTDGIFSDRTHTSLGEGDLLDEDSGRVIFGAGAVPTKGDLVTIQGNVYSRLAANVQRGTANDRIKVTATEMMRFYEGKRVVLAGGAAYTVAEVDLDALTIALKDDSDNTPTFSTWGFSIYEALGGVECTVLDVDREDSTFAVGDRAGNAFYLTTLGDAAAWTGRYTHVEPVCAEWVTPIMDFGTNVQSKSLLAMTVATEPGIGGAVTVGYETRRILTAVTTKGAVALSAVRQGETDTPSDGTPFSLDRLDFEELTFDASFAHSYTKRMSVRNFNFIVLRFGSDTDTDCAVSGITLRYKINQNNKGVR